MSAAPEETVTLLSVRENSALSATTSREDSPSPFASSHDSIQRLTDASDTDRMLRTHAYTASDVISCDAKPEVVEYPATGSDVFNFVSLSQFDFRN